MSFGSPSGGLCAFCASSRYTITFVGVIDYWQDLFKNMKTQSTELNPKTVLAVLAVILGIVFVSVIFAEVSVLMGTMALLVSGWGIALYKTKKSLPYLLTHLSNYKILLTFSITLSIWIIFNSAIVGGLLLLAIVWLYNDQEGVKLQERIGNFKQHYIRLVLSALVIVCASSIAYMNFKNTKHEELVNSYPVPEITIISSKENQGDNKEYKLRFTVENGMAVEVNGKEVATEDGVFTTVLALRAPKTRIRIDASNEHKTNQQTIYITRNETVDERQNRLEREEAQRKQREEKAAREKFERESADGSKASVCAKMYVESHLKAPSTAKFPWSSGTVLPQGENKYIVKNYVDAQNSFGAMIRTNYVCVVHVLDAENYTCDTSCEM